MKRILKKGMSLTLTLALVLSMFCGMTITASAAGISTTGLVANIYADNQISGGVTPTTNTYQQYTYTFTATNTSTPVSILFRHDPDYFYFDDFSVTKTDDSTELITNGSFEDTYTASGEEYPSDWNLIGTQGLHAAGCIDDNAHSEDCCWGDGAVGGFDGLQQTITTEVGTTYTISFYLAAGEWCNTQAASTDPETEEDYDEVSQILIYVDSLPDGFTVTDPETANSVAKNTTTNATYTDVSTALNAAADGQTVQMLKDVATTSCITYNRNGIGVTLDLNGYTITCTSDISDEADTNPTNGAVYVQDGTLTIGDTSANANGYIKLVNENIRGSGLNIGEKGTVNLLSGGILGYGQAVYAFEAGAHFNMSGGVVYGCYDSNYCEALAAISGANISISGGYMGTYNSSAAMIWSDAALDTNYWSITGGYYTSKYYNDGTSKQIADFVTGGKTIVDLDPKLTNAISGDLQYNYQLTVPITITFDATTNGAVCTTASANTASSGKLSTLPVATKDGEIFAGWYTEASGGTKITTNYVFGASATVYARFMNYWTDNGNYNTDWYTADTTKTNYTISTNAELAGLAYLVNSGTEDFSGKTITLSANGNFDLGDHLWVPIGIEINHPFSGVFDGNGKAVSGLIVYSTDKEFVGLFGYTDGATIKNTSVAGSITSSLSAGSGLWVGGLVGAAADTSITGCSSSVNISAIQNAYPYGNCTGGLVGQLLINNSSASITDCFATGNVESTSSIYHGSVYNYCGGLVGFVTGVPGANSKQAYVTSCYATGDVNGISSNKANLDIGGLIGATICGTVTGSHATGAVTSSTEAEASCAGGLIGHLAAGSYLDNSYATGSITRSGNGTNSYNGGLVGINSATVESSYSTGTVSIGGSLVTVLYEGGSVGYSTGEIRNSYSTGAISTTAACPAIYLAGMVALNEGGAVTNCYSSGAISKSGPSAAAITPGDFVCSNNGGSITDCYWLSHESNYTDSGVLVGGTINSLTKLTSDQLANTGTIGSTNTTVGTSTFSANTVVDALNAKARSASYSKAWKVVSGTNSGYPILCGGIATINIVKNSAAAAADGAVELWQSGSKVAEAVSSSTGVYKVLMPDGIYNIYINGSNSGSTIEINGTDKSVTVDCTPVTHSSGGGGSTNDKTISVSSVSSTVFAGSDKSLFSVKANMQNAFSNSVEVKVTDNTTESTEITSFVGAGGKVYPFDISLYVKGTDTKTKPASGYAVTITMPLPESLWAQRDTLSLIHDASGTIETIPFTLVQKGNAWCITFEAKSFSPYALVTGMTNKGVQTSTENGLPYYLDNNGNKVFIGFATKSNEATRYIEATGKKILFASNAKSFSDISGHWAKYNIGFVTERELFLGTGNSIFSPNSGMTRAMFATVLGRLYERSYGAIASASSGNFTDVNYTDWYGKYVNWAAENNIISGVGGGKFQPDTQITRQEMAAMLYRFAEYLDIAPAGGSNTALTYSDASSISDWAAGAALYCQKTGIITGRDGGTFVPKGTATRAEVAVILERFINNVLH
ncbi:MAG: hypothetical protein H6Q64_525 [Firmicutes bacterium]|nr:hypothetical protein [Bacillota bacterium]